MKTHNMILHALMTVLLIAPFASGASVNGGHSPRDPEDIISNPPEEVQPYAPFILGFYDEKTSSLRFDWEDKSQVEDGNEVWRKQGNAEWVLIEDIGPGQSQFFLEPPYLDNSGNLLPDRSYCYKIVAYKNPGPANENRLSSSSNIACAYTDRPDPKGGVRFTTLRVLTHNIFGLTDTGLLDLHPETCGNRATALGKAVAIADPPYDIVGLQEYYNTRLDPEWVTCDAHHLRDAIEEQGNLNFVPYRRFEGPQNSFTFQPDGEGYNFEADGGIGIYTPHPINDNRQSWEFTEKGPWLQTRGSLQGFLFAQIPIVGTGITVDTYVVHTYSIGSDHCDRTCRQSELAQLANTIHEQSSQSGNPVLIMGDFNIKAPEPLALLPKKTDYSDFCYLQPIDLNYPPTVIERCLKDSRFEDIENALRNPRDLWVDNHPDESGYTSDNCESGLPTNCTKGGSKRIDYIFVPTDEHFTNSPYTIHVRNRDDVKVVTWSDFGYHVSDHYGVEATIEIWETPANGLYESTSPGNQDYNLTSSDSPIWGSHAPSPDKVNKTFGSSEPSRITKPLGAPRAAEPSTTRGMQPIWER